MEIIYVMQLVLHIYDYFLAVNKQWFLMVM